MRRRFLGGGPNSDNCGLEDFEARGAVSTSTAGDAWRSPVERHGHHCSQSDLPNINGSLNFQQVARLACQSVSIKLASRPCFSPDEIQRNPGASPRKAEKPAAGAVQYQTVPWARKSNRRGPAMRLRDSVSHCPMLISSANRQWKPSFAAMAAFTDAGPYACDTRSFPAVSHAGVQVMRTR